MTMSTWAVEEERLWDEYLHLARQVPRDVGRVSAAYEAHRLVLPGAKGYTATGDIKDYCWGGHGPATQA